ncbi:MAG: type II toxin-antitoxin system death-on-curing family toxin [Carnobacterium sp.]
MIVYLTEKEIILINAFVIAKINPKEQIGVKVPTALSMCVEQPKQFVFGQELYPKLEDKAAILFELLVNKHCFFNGNKQTAAISLDIVLKKNQRILTCSNKILVNFTVDLAEKRGNERISHNEIVEWIKQHSSKLN